MIKLFVPKERFELSCISATASKTAVSTVPPFGHLKVTFHSIIVSFNLTIHLQTITFGRIEGIEPSSSGWKPDIIAIIPHSHLKVVFNIVIITYNSIIQIQIVTFERIVRIELTTLTWKDIMLPLAPYSLICSNTMTLKVITLLRRV